MAAVDKLYVKYHHEYDDLLRWSMIYYPKLLQWFYDIHLTWENFNGKNVAIMNTPTKIDQKLKWICPLPFVREYLHKQCGVNPKYEWLYKIFWRGRKYYSY